MFNFVKTLLFRLPVISLVVISMLLSIEMNASNFVYNARDFGARGDGTTIDSDAINRAIVAASESGGGTVFFPAGTYASYSIRLKSNIRLFIDAGATILGAEPVGTIGYDAPEEGPGNEYQDFGHSHWHNSLIWGENLVNVSICGSGTIYGKGLTRGGPYKAPVGNKAIALKLCRNVILKDFTILYGGHFGILATGVDNFTIDNLKIDTNRDGIDVDCCKNVRISNCTVNSPWDDAICLKSSYALGYSRATENVTITNCQVSGYDRGTLIDGTYLRKEPHLVPDKEGPTGRIKFGTESNGGFKKITISNCVFEYCRGLALETVDGGLLEDVAISNVVMRDIINSPIFLRLGARMRGPENTPVGKLRRVTINNLVVYNADSRFSCLITGIPGHLIEDVSLNNIKIWYKPLEAGTQIPDEVPEYEDKYPEPQKFGIIPAYGFFIRHARNIQLNNVEVNSIGNQERPAMMLTDVQGVELRNVVLAKTKSSPLLVLKEVGDLLIFDCKDLENSRKKVVNYEVIK